MVRYKQAEIGKTLLTQLSRNVGITLSQKILKDWSIKRHAWKIKQTSWLIVQERWPAIYHCTSHMRQTMLLWLIIARSKPLYNWRKLGFGPGHSSIIGIACIWNYSTCTFSKSCVVFHHFTGMLFLAIYKTEDASLTRNRIPGKTLWE